MFYFFCILFFSPRTYVEKLSRYMLFKRIRCSVSCTDRGWLQKWVVALWILYSYLYALQKYKSFALSELSRSESRNT